MLEEELLTGVGRRLCCHEAELVNTAAVLKSVDMFGSAARSGSICDTSDNNSD